MTRERRYCGYCAGVLHSHEGLADPELPNLEFCDEPCLSYYKTLHPPTNSTRVSKITAEDERIRAGLEAKYFSHLSNKPPPELLGRLWEDAVNTTLTWSTSRAEEKQGIKDHYRFLAELVLWPEKFDD